MFPENYEDFKKTFEYKPFGRVQVIYDSETHQVYLIQEPLKRFYVSWKNKLTDGWQTIEYGDLQMGKSELFRFMKLLSLHPEQEHQKTAD